MNLKGLNYLLSILFLVSNSTLATPMLIWEDNAVVGVSGVSVNSVNFEIEFSDGAFTELYPDGIDPMFEYQNATDTWTPGNAWLPTDPTLNNNIHLALDDIAYAFSHDPSFNDADYINGCSSSADGISEPLGYCYFLLPYFTVEDLYPEFTGYAGSLLVGIGDSGLIGVSATDAFVDSLASPTDNTISDNTTFAVVARVSEPGTIFLLLGGLGLVSVFRRPRDLFAA